MNEMVYASTVVLRHPEPGEFARVLGPAPTGTRYRDYAPERSSSHIAARWEPVPLVRETRAPAKAKAAPKPRWTPERIEALPRHSGMLTRTGQVIEPSRQGPMIRVCCAGGTIRCKRSYLTLATVFESIDRPQSCMPCSYERRRKASAFTQKGYAAARDFAAKERETQKAQEGVAA